jgi:hypothetical protein
LSLIAADIARNTEEPLFPRLITSSFQYYINSYRQQELEMEPDSERDQTGLPSIQEKMDSWVMSPDAGAEDPEDSGNESDEEASQYPQYYPESRQFIVESAGFRNFLLAIDSYTNVTSRMGTKLASIRKEVLDVIYSQSVTAESANSAFLEVEWNPATFFHLTLPTREDRSISDILSLTSCAGEIQAATLGEYLQQMWSTGGKLTLDALQTAFNLHSTGESKHFVRTQCNTFYNCSNFVVSMLTSTDKFSNQTAVTILQMQPKLYLEITGLAHEVAEVVEQFAWLGAACRISPYEVGGLPLDGGHLK